MLLRKDEHWFVQDEPVAGGGYETWPVTRADLEPHYDAVEAMLGATPDPLHAPVFADTLKTHAMAAAAKQQGLDFQLPPLAVSFAPRPGAEPGVGLPLDEPAYGNLHGVPRRTCRLVGECDLGCNDGAKNSLDHTYLSAAAHHGADLRTLCEVRGFAPLDGGASSAPRSISQGRAAGSRPTCWAADARSSAAGSTCSCRATPRGPGTCITGCTSATVAATR